MKNIIEKRYFEYPIAEVWKIISDVSRTDWVPGVDSIVLEGDTRVFKFKGMGDLVEKILLLDNENHKLQYSAIKTDMPIKHHLATIKLDSEESRTIFTWSTEIDPEIFAEGILNGMVTSLDALQSILKKED